MTAARGEFLAVGPAVVRRLSNNLPTTVFAVFRLTAPVVDVTRLSCVGDYEVFGSRLRHLSHGGGRIEASPFRHGSRFDLDWTVVPRSLETLPRLDLDHFTRANHRLADGSFSERKIGDSYLSDLVWFVEGGTVAGRRIAKFDVYPLVELARALQARAETRIVLHDGRLHVPARMPFWVASTSDYSVSGPFRPVLRQEDYHAGYKVWPADRLADAAEFCRLRNHGEPIAEEGRVHLHVPAPPLKRHGIRRIAAWAGTYLRSFPGYDPIGMDAACVGAFHDLENHEAILDADDNDGAERILRAYCRVFEQLPSRGVRDQPFGWTEAADLHRRLVMDGYGADASPQPVMGLAA